MSVRVYLEIGHEACLRAKKTPEGFTHDWEVYVRGVNDAEIGYFIEKVVFYLHETFPKPKRVVKEPPYFVKESGYAGFNLPIDIYLRNSQEPKKVRVNYDLQLQPSGPAIRNVQKEKFVFNTACGDFRERLLRAGGKVISSETSESGRFSGHEEKHLTKPRPTTSSDAVKKSKPKPESTCTSFQDLFGPPITTSRALHIDTSSSNTKLGKSSSKNSKGPTTSVSKHNASASKEKSKEPSSSTSKSSNIDKKTIENTLHERHKDEEQQKSVQNSPPHSQTKPPLPTSKVKTDNSSSGGKSKERPDKNPWDYKKLKKDKQDVRKLYEKIPQRSFLEQSEMLSNDQRTCKSISDSKRNATSVSGTSSEKTHSTAEKTKVKRSNEALDRNSSKDKRDKKEHKYSKKTEKVYTSKESEKLATTLSDSEDMDYYSTNLKTSTSNKSYLPEHPAGSKKIEDDRSSLGSNQDVSSREYMNNTHLEAPYVGHKKSTYDANSKKNTEKSKKTKTKPRKKHSSLSDTEEFEDDSSYMQADILSDDLQTEEYMNTLRDLQHKIMRINNNNELQQVVQVIADTGRFEISASTFDFDLCTLDQSTVRQLQKIFVGGS